MIESPALNLDTVLFWLGICRDTVVFNVTYSVLSLLLFGSEEMPWNHYEVYCYGTQRILTADMTLIDENFAKANRQCIPEELQAEVFQRIA